MRVKPQGGKSQAHILRALVDAGIPTASHIGLTPHNHRNVRRI